MAPSSPSTPPSSQYFDGRIFAYGEAPLDVFPRNATVANIISGAANHHEITPEQAVELAVRL